jgi:hypothetical protein
MFAGVQGIEAILVHEDQTHEIFRTECLVASLSEEMPKRATSSNNLEPAHAHESAAW